jgi:large subunit ribosomal protein L22
MEIRSIAKSVRMSPRKIRLVADAVRYMSIDNAIATLAVSEKRAAIPLAKAFKSAVANAVNNASLEKSSLIIESINITDGTPLKRFHPSSRGRTHPYKRRSSNIRIVLKQKVTPAVILNQPKSEDIAKTKGLKETASVIPAKAGIQSLHQSIKAKILKTKKNEKTKGEK